MATDGVGDIQITRIPSQLAEEMRQGHAQTRQGHAQAREDDQDVSRQRAVLSHELDAKRSARQTDKTSSCAPMTELGWSLAKLSDHVLPDLFSTTFGEHIEDELDMRGDLMGASGEPPLWQNAGPHIG